MFAQAQVACNGEDYTNWGFSSGHPQPAKRLVILIFKNKELGRFNKAI